MFSIHFFFAQDFDGALDCISIAITCSFNRRGTLLAVGCNDGRIVIWDFLTRGIAKIISAHVHPVCSLRCKVTFYSYFVYIAHCAYCAIIQKEIWPAKISSLWFVWIAKCFFLCIFCGNKCKAKWNNIHPTWFEINSWTLLFADIVLSIFILIEYNWTNDENLKKTQKPKNCHWSCYY